mmetsp:Transcript_2899/g.7617  ORF Transcript_2899/g.7617 Transcript_2899/m.7617 type:complete len:298 (+) Transcript_2899:127-1020(+)
MMRNQTCTKTKLYVPGWFRDGHFLFTLPRTDRSMLPLANWLFARYGLTQVRYPFQQPPSDPDVVELPFHPNSTRPWSDQPVEWLHYMRSYGHELAGATDAPGDNFDVLIVRRADPHKQGNAGAVRRSKNKCKRPVYCNTGAARRHLPPAFFTDAEKAFATHGVSFRIVELAAMTLAEQVRTFAQAPVILGLHGAGLSNTIFAPPGAVLVEYGLRGNNCYKRLATKMGLTYVHANDVAKTFGPNTRRAALKAVASARKALGIKRVAPPGDTNHAVPTAQAVTTSNSALSNENIYSNHD